MPTPKAGLSTLPITGLENLMGSALIIGLAAINFSMKVELCVAMSRVLSERERLTKGNIMAKKSPTQCTLDKWRKEGYVCAVVEKWNAHTKIRQDLFGFIDVLAVGNGETVAIQTTSRPHVSTRVKKIEDDEDKIYKALCELRKAGWKIIVEGWYKEKNRWQCREVDIS